MKNNNLKYLIAGTGGVGGSIAAFLALAGKDVTCIARGGHLAALRENGLKLHSDLKGEHTLDVPAYTAEEYAALASSADAYKADVIFVCVKGYSVDSITELIRHAAHKDTVVIPILNVYGTGPRIQRLVPGVYGTGRLHLHRRIRIRQRRNHANGQDIPVGLRGTQRHHCFP